MPNSQYYSYCLGECSNNSGKGLIKWKARALLSKRLLSDISYTSSPAAPLKSFFGKGFFSDRYLGLFICGYRKSVRYHLWYYSQVSCTTNHRFLTQLLKLLEFHHNEGRTWLLLKLTFEFSTFPKNKKSQNLHFFYIVLNH